MKQIYILLVAMCAIAFTGCSKDDDEPKVDPKEEWGEIKMQIEMKRIYAGDLTLKLYFKPDPTWWEDNDNIEYTLFEANPPSEFEINWGDGQITRSTTHTYAQEGTYSITIKGKGIEYFYYVSEDEENTGEIISIDFSKCPYIKYIEGIVGNNPIIDISQNTEIEFLGILDDAQVKYKELPKLRIIDMPYTLFKEFNNKNLEFCVVDNGEKPTTSLSFVDYSKLKYLDFCNGQLTSLDLTGCSALSELLCFYNNLTSLELTGCSALTYVNCGGNNLSATALNKILTDLPQGKTWTDKYGYTQQSEISISGNPGYNTCNKSIAENKGWKVN